MRLVIFAVCSFLLYATVQGFNIGIFDPENKYYLNTTLTLTFSIKPNAAEDFANSTTIANATVEKLGDGDQLPEGSGRRAVFYRYKIIPNVTTFVKDLSLSVQAQRSKDNERRYIEEFQVQATFDPYFNISDTMLTFLVSPPRFPHFQVKTDWQYRCPVSLSLNLCNVANGTTPSCSNTEPYNRVTVSMSLDDTVFSGGKDPYHDYSARQELCPLEYQTRPDIGIGCIVAFWSIALAALLWILIKFLLKRKRKQWD